MKRASLAAVFVFSLVGIAHLLRIVFKTEVVVGGATIPLWVSVLGLVVPAALAVALWREARSGSS